MSIDSTHWQAEHTVGAKIRAARLLKKYTQGQLARPDFSVSYISAIERGHIQPSLRALELLARRLDLSSAQMFPQGYRMEDGRRGFLPMGANRERERIELALVEAHVCILQGAFVEALAQLDSLPAQKLQAWERWQHRYLLGLAYYHTSQLQKCEEELLPAVHQAEEHKDLYGSLRAHNLLGLAYAAGHNYEQAIQSHQRCLALLENAAGRDPLFLCQTYSALGQNYMQLENVGQAVEMLKQALEISGAFPGLDFLQMAYSASCQYYGQADYYTQARLYALKCDHLYNQRASSALMGEIYHFLGRALLKGDHETARAFLERALQEESVQQEPLCVASLVTHLAAWHLAQANLDLAEQYAHQAFELATPFGDTIITMEAVLTLARIAFGQARYEEGDRQFVDGLDMLKRLGICDELAEQAADYAQRLEARGLEQEAFTFYRLAYQSIHRQD